MGLFDPLANKHMKAKIESEVDRAAHESKPYFYLTISGFGEPDQKLPDGFTGVPEELLEVAKHSGSGLAFSAMPFEPDESTYLDGVLCTFYAGSRMEAAGAILAFTCLETELIYTSLMRGVAEEVSGLALDETGEHCEEHASEVFEFKKSPDGSLIITLPTADDDGEFSFSGCFVTVRAPRRTDSEVAKIVSEAAFVLRSTGNMPSLMCTLHQDIDSYGTLGDEEE